MLRNDNFSGEEQQMKLNGCHPSMGRAVLQEPPRPFLTVEVRINLHKNMWCSWRTESGTWSSFLCSTSVILSYLSITTVETTPTT